MICGSGGSKSMLAKATGAEPSGQMRDEKIARRCGLKHISKSKCIKHTTFGPLLEVEMSKKCTPLWREAHFQVKMYKTHQPRTTFGSCDVEKVHAVVARSTFPSQNVQKHTTFGPLLEVEMCKKCTPLWREAHFEQNVKNTRGSDHFWRFRCRKSARRCGAKHISRSKVRTTFGGSDVASLHYTTLHYATLHPTTLHDKTLHYTTLQYTTLHYTTKTTLNSSTLHYTKLHYTTLHYTTLRSTTLHYITLHYTTLHYTTLHYTTLSSTTLHYLTLHYTPSHYNYNYNYTTTLHYTPLHSTTLNYTTLHYTTFRHTPLHHTTLHYTTLHWMTLHHR